MLKAFKILPKNYLADWGEFESWSAGTTAVPDGWLAATACTYAQSSTYAKYGNYGLAMVAGTDGGAVYRTIPDGADYAGRTFKLGAWAYAAGTGATGPYLKLDDGVTESTAHISTPSAWENLIITKKLDASATQIRIEFVVPTMSQTAYFDSAVLCEGEDLFTNLYGNIDVSDFAPTLNLKEDAYEIANREGSFIPEYHLRDKTIRVKGNVIGSDFASCRSNFDTLMASLLSWQKNEMRDLYLYDDRVYEAYLKSFDHNYVNSLLMVKFNLSFIISDAMTRYIAKLRHSQVIAATATEFNFVYNGNVESKPLITFIADQAEIISTCSLENLTTGENLAFTGSVGTAYSLAIDTKECTVMNNAVDEIQYFTGDFLKLVRGTNYFRFSGSKCTIHIDWFDRWY